MHSYATDSDERRRITLILSLLSIAIAFAVHEVSSTLGVESSLWFISAFGLFSVLYVVFDNFAWQWPICKQMKLVNVPNLAGTWTGTVTPADEKYRAKYDATLTITQRWTHINIELATETSRSKSLWGNLTVHEGAWPSLSYEYLNEPHPGTVGTMQKHRGVAHLILRRRDGLDQLVGDYYSDGGRQNVGMLEFRRRS